MGVIRKTKENLKEAAEGKNLEILTMYPRFIEEAEAEAEGREDAVKSFRMAFERERHHRAMFQQALKDMG